MSYTVNVTGHIEGDADAAKSQEEQAVQEAREFVDGLPGVSSASFSGRYTGYTDLRAANEADAGDDS